VEFALLMPMAFLLIVNAINLGAFIYFWITVSDAARTVADSVSFGALSVGSPAPPADPAIRQILSNSGLGMQYCLNTNNTTSPVSATCPSFSVDPIPAEPEGGTYTLIVVDVSYRYDPIFPSLNLPMLGLYSTIPSSTIKRRVVTRMLN
jgi:Flp pilus assembly protein TadG